MNKKFRTKYDYVQTGSIKFEEPSMTQGQFKNECDIHTIINNYVVTGQLTGGLGTDRGPGTYGDFTDLGDYQSNLNKVIEAQNMFNDLPSNIRYRFHNNPAEMIEFVLDEGNRAEAIKLGMLRVDESGVTPAAPESPVAGDGE